MTHSARSLVSALAPASITMRSSKTDTTVAAKVGRPHLLVLDPPRAGAGVKVAKAIVDLSPRRVAYVACDPATFARDLKVFLDAGWEMPSLRAFDLFPMTEHVELVAILQPSP